MTHRSMGAYTSQTFRLNEIQVCAFQQVENLMCKQCLGSGCSGSPLRVLGLMRFIGLPVPQMSIQHTDLIKV